MASSNVLISRTAGPGCDTLRLRSFDLVQDWSGQVGWLGLDVRGSSQVGNGTGHFEDLVVGPACATLRSKLRYKARALLRPVVCASLNYRAKEGH